MKNKIIVISLLLVFAIVFSSCSNSNDMPSADPAERSETSTEPCSRINRVGEPYMLDVAEGLAEMKEYEKKYQSEYNIGEIKTIEFFGKEYDFTLDSVSKSFMERRHKIVYVHKIDDKKNIRVLFDPDIEKMVSFSARYVDTGFASAEIVTEDDIRSVVSRALYEGMGRTDIDLNEYVADNMNPPLSGAPFTRGVHVSFHKYVNGISCGAVNVEIDGNGNVIFLALFHDELFVSDSAVPDWDDDYYISAAKEQLDEYFHNIAPEYHFKDYSVRNKQLAYITKYECCAIYYDLVGTLVCDESDQGYLDGMSFIQLYEIIDE